jgi:hypothetical protein
LGTSRFFEHLGTILFETGNATPDQLEKFLLTHTLGRRYLLISR